MSDIAIHAENLGKMYRIGRRARQHDTLSGWLTSWVHTPWQNFQQLRRQHQFNADAPDVFWALSDVNFSIKHGEVWGVLGSNGAGKSTLLKILSQITAPTTGFVEVHGRIAGLLEVGTGFNHELTGRENIYLNGAILGMSKREINQKFDQIVDFSGVETFLDTPVKRYSSGMKVRLAFAVAAHLEPDILVIDEVLAVGDAAFQQKCLGKMQEVSQKQGRTVLFVSHDMGAIASLCPNSLWLENGQIKDSGPSANLIQTYLQGKPVARPKAGFSIQVVAKDREHLVFKQHEPLHFQVEIQSEHKADNVSLYLLLKKDGQQNLLHYRLDHVVLRERSQFDFHIAALSLVPGQYDMEIKLLLTQGLEPIRITSAHPLILTGEVSHFMNHGLLQPAIQCRQSH
jgi:ABC-type polysaccharide/polyol phosphate transport system ATPase subunit